MAGWSDVSSAVMQPAGDLGLDPALWTATSSDNSTLLYIEVEYVKNYKLEDETQGSLGHHVSPLDPNMSSVARYSPVYAEHNPEFVIQELVAPPIRQQDNAFIDALLLENQPQIVPKVEQLLMVDESTGISYSVNAQELLVQNTLDEEDKNLLEALAPEPLLETDLLTLDETTLKNELQEDLSINFRRRNLTELEAEDQLLSCVYSITDRPILSRARASLPENYLIINEIDKNFGVFAKKTIPMRTQFGPLEGVIQMHNEDILRDDTKLQLFMKNQNNIYRMEISDENSSNWMSFVRKAHTFEEQNLVLSQEQDGLYFTTTKPILSKQELKVGYSCSYAQTFNLQILEEIQEKTWNCFECSGTFVNSHELQEHLNVHDPKTKKKKTTFKSTQKEALECNLCKVVNTQYTFSSLMAHLKDAHKFVDECKVEDHFTVVLSYKCELCEVAFKNEDLLKLHQWEHDPDSFEEQDKITRVCPVCHRKFPTKKQLVLHIRQHTIHKAKLKQDFVKCPVCYKMFALRERLQKHMLVHGSEESKPLQCKTCKKRFLNNSALACHVKTHFAGKKVFECPICRESFDHVLKLKLHVPKHRINELFTCPHCEKKFKKYSIVRKHIRAFHSERKHHCEHCSKMFPTLDKLRMHSLRHSDHREFLCEDCGKQFKRKDKLTEHCKRMHEEERENTMPDKLKNSSKKLSAKVEPQDFHRFIYKCHACLVGFKRRGMLVNHLAKRHPDIPPDSVPELNLPILQTTRDYYCQYCDKVYKSSSKRKAHILKNHPGAALPMSNRKQGIPSEIQGLPNPTFSQTVGSITTRPQNCKWCFKQYASKAKLLQHQRKKHAEQLLEQPKSEIPEEISFEIAKLQETTLPTSFSKEDMDLIDAADITYENSYHLSTMDGTDVPSEFVELGSPNSHLYRLLTTSNGLLPPR